jgi:hypothetical protein
VLGLRFYVLQGMGLPAVAVLAIEIVVGGGVYVATALVVCRATAKDLLSMLRKIAKR